MDMVMCNIEAQTPPMISLSPELQLPPGHDDVAR